MNAVGGFVSPYWGSALVAFLKPCRWEWPIPLGARILGRWGWFFPPLLYGALYEAPANHLCPATVGTVAEGGGVPHGVADHVAQPEEREGEHREGDGGEDLSCHGGQFGMPVAKAPWAPRRKGCA